MLPKLPISGPLPKIGKRVNGKDASLRGAFFYSDTIEFSLSVPRALGAAGVVLRIMPDHGHDTDLPLAFKGTACGTDTYELTLSLAALCGDRGYGLFYYEFLFIRGCDTLFTNTKDNVTFELLTYSTDRFRLLVSEDGFETPRWTRGGVIYHIFVDRFAKGAGERRADAFYHENWDEEIVQYGAYPGAPVRNDEFFGGTLHGIREKLDYLKSLGVTLIYLSPIFKANSNHKYDTGDYGLVDPQFGGDEALQALLDDCKKCGIRVMLDGVFNHTGDDSIYFNKRGNYDSVGAYQSVDSPYAGWYFFKRFPVKYECWWDIGILPKLNLHLPAVREYFTGEGGILQKYLRMGVSGVRLDVADELPDEFLDALRARVKNETDGEGLVLGEVWENAADKVAYGKRRRYFSGRQLDSVMNYPVRRGIISFVKEGNAKALAAVLREIWSSYPVTVCHSLMNLLSTHDTERIITVLAGASDRGKTNTELRDMRLSCDEYAWGVRLLTIAAVLQYTVFGVPSLFYGDEAGLEGYHDPFCRRPFPWGREDATLQALYQRLGTLRATHEALKEGDFEVLTCEDRAILYRRSTVNETLLVAANRGKKDFIVALPRGAIELLSGKVHEGGGRAVAPDTAEIWRLNDVRKKKAE